MIELNGFPLQPPPLPRVRACQEPPPPLPPPPGLTQPDVTLHRMVKVMRSEAHVAASPPTAHTGHLRGDLSMGPGPSPGSRLSPSPVPAPKRSAKPCPQPGLLHPSVKHPSAPCLGCRHCPTPGDATCESPQYQEAALPGCPAASPAPHGVQRGQLPKPLSGGHIWTHTKWLHCP